MSTYLNSLGYYRDSLNYAARIDTVGKEYRTTVDFNLVSTKLFHLDSISFNMFSDTSDQIVYSAARDTLQRLTMNSLKQSLQKAAL